MNECKHENLKEHFHGDRQPIMYCVDCGVAYGPDGIRYGWYSATFEGDRDE